MPISNSSVVARPAWIWAAVIIAAGLLVLLLSSSSFSDFMDEVIAWTEEVMDDHPVGGASVFFVFSALSAMLAFASSIVLVPAANLVWGQVITFILLWAGWLAGAIAAYGIGAAARPLLVRLIAPDRIKRYQRFVSKRMSFWMVLLACLTVPSEIPGYAFGSAHYSFPKFLVAMALAEAVYAAGAVIVGETLVADRPFLMFAAVGVIATVAIAAGWLLRRMRTQR